jgi:hypothetical protein
MFNPGRVWCEQGIRRRHGREWNADMPSGQRKQRPLKIVARQHHQWALWSETTIQQRLRQTANLGERFDVSEPGPGNRLQQLPAKPRRV